MKAFTKAMANSMAADSPERFVSTIPKARRHGKILIDYLRNQRGMTAVAAYSTRARPGATVSMPLAWEELTPEIGPAYFTTRNTPARLSSVADPWADFRAAAAPIEEERKTSQAHAEAVRVRGDENGHGATSSSQSHHCERTEQSQGNTGAHGFWIAALLRSSR